MDGLVALILRGEFIFVRLIEDFVDDGRHEVTGVFRVVLANLQILWEFMADKLRINRALSEEANANNA